MPTSITGSIHNREWRAEIRRDDTMRAVHLEFGIDHGGRTFTDFQINNFTTRSELKAFIMGELMNTVVLRYSWDGINRVVDYQGLHAISRDRIAKLVMEGFGIDDEGAGGCICTSCRGVEGEPPELNSWTCEWCDRTWESEQDYTEEGDTVNYRPGPGMRNIESWLCFNCQSDSLAYCEGHGGRVDTSECAYDWDYNQCHECRPDGQGLVNEWNYRPHLIFHPFPPEPGTQPLYIGMELEVSFDEVRRGYAWLEEHIQQHEDLLYAKEDSSVDYGFEVVSHPFQPAWGMDNFPFQEFQAGIERYGLRPTHESTGTHIHMNKDAFTPAHLWKILQVHMKLPEFCGMVGGRGTKAGFGSFAPNRRSTEVGNFLGVQRQQLLEIAKKKGKFDNPERYVAVNLRNEYTIELRYMRGGVGPNEIKKNIQWAMALYDFSGYIDMKDVRDGALKDPGNFLWFIRNEPVKYRQLIEWIDKEIPQAKPLRERTV